MIDERCTKSPLGNCDQMTELKWHYGYPMVIGLMLAITSSVAIYFYRKGIFANDPSRREK